VKNILLKRSDAASALNMLAGSWLVISPWVLGFLRLQAPFLDTILVGVAVLILAAIRLEMSGGACALSCINFLLGLWLLMSPFVLDFTSAMRATGNAIVLGILVGILGLWAALVTPKPVTPSR
jgi:SPW repeat